MVIIEYDPVKGEPLSDGRVEAIAQALIDMDWESLDHTHTLIYSTDNIFAALRCAIAEGRLDCDRVRFKFGEIIFQANRYGAIHPWPNGFCDTSVNYGERVLKAATTRRQTERGK